MQIEFREDETRRLVGVRHIGPYHEIGEAFGRMGQWLATSGIQDAGPMVGIYWDDPRSTPENELRSDACVQIPAGVEISDPSVTVSELPGGLRAYLPHRGSYAKLGESWGALMGGVFAAGRRPNGPGYEVYLNDCSKVPEAELITELYQPVE